ncbi:MAG: DNA-directed RNA polymerase subunit omega [Sedimentisphaerales bacterium]
MIEDLKSTDIIKKVGGKYRLTALIQRRMAELMEGARPLIEGTKGKTQMEIVIQEILQDKIAADSGAGNIDKLKE